MGEEIIKAQWENIKDTIHNVFDITDIAYNIWVKPLRFAGCDDHTVRILIPNSKPEGRTQMLDYITKNYKKYFQEVISDMLMDSYRVVFFMEEEASVPKQPMNIPVSSNSPVPENVEYDSNLNSKYYFENFVVGSNNKMAHSVCLRVAEAPGKELNPLFIHGGSGLGKTHLMTAIGHYIIENTDFKVIYVTSEDFLNEVIESIRNNNNTAMSRFREKYRNIDVLLIDDIQFIIGKAQTQVEFFNTFNALIQNGKQIVITSDKHPAHIKDLDERIRSRFLSGMTVDIQPPAYETRVAILRKYAENFDTKVPDNVIDYIAEHIKSNIRELEGAYK